MKSNESTEQKPQCNKCPLVNTFGTSKVIHVNRAASLKTLAIFEDEPAKPLKCGKAHRLIALIFVYSTMYEILVMYCKPQEHPLISIKQFLWQPRYLCKTIHP